MDKKDRTALSLVKERLQGKYGYDEDAVKSEEIFISVKAKCLKNYKYLIGSSYDNCYYELTFNGELNEWYIDTYEKVSNEVVSIGDYDIL